MLCLQISCGFAVMRGRNWGAGAMWSPVHRGALPAVGHHRQRFPEVFTGETSGQILHVLIPKDPRRGDPGVAVRPTASRRFFAARK